jgi:ankyrin repeat protein
LHHAASQNFNDQCKIVSQLLDKEKDLLEKTSADGRTALFFASYYGNAEVVQLLLSAAKYGLVQGFYRGGPPPYISS